MQNKPWRLAYSLQKLREQLDDAFPERSHESDGSIGDARHQSSKSDHNPHVKLGNMGIVTAIDITHDPRGGLNCTELAEILKLDPRVKYVIWNRMIYNPAIKTSWRRYRGANPHTKHMHISVMPIPKFYDDTKLWLLR